MTNIHKNRRVHFLLLKFIHAKELFHHLPQHALGELKYLVTLDEIDFPDKILLLSFIVLGKQNRKHNAFYDLFVVQKYTGMCMVFRLAWGSPCSRKPRPHSSCFFLMSAQETASFADQSILLCGGGTAHSDF